jgi:hypothetical protein
MTIEYLAKDRITARDALKHPFIMTFAPHHHHRKSIVSPPTAAAAAAVAAVTAAMSSPTTPSGLR